MFWLKAFHIISVVCWFAGLFYLPRLFVYHAASQDKATQEQFKVMERRLYRGITTPAMLATVLFGSWLIALYPDYYLIQGWLHIKLLLVALLIGYHFYCGKLLRLFAEDKNQRSHVFYRWLNEVPTLILISAVILAVVKPF
ncbi:MAG: TIGR00701 family protein [Gammaproteobacteria bacterium]|nr:MAG: TIGR00701 family protein [Gammaproteobacteria bacterium]